jgi:hypothetical protein
MSCRICVRVKSNTFVVVVVVVVVFADVTVTIFVFSIDGDGKQSLEALLARSSEVFMGPCTRVSRSGVSLRVNHVQPRLMILTYETTMVFGDQNPARFTPTELT